MSSAKLAGFLSQLCSADTLAPHFIPPTKALPFASNANMRVSTMSKSNITPAYTQMTTKARNWDKLVYMITHSDLLSTDSLHTVSLLNRLQSVDLAIFQDNLQEATKQLKYAQTELSVWINELESNR